MKAIMKALIKGYAKLISPILGPNCRFHPTCSAYAVQAIDKHGPLKGAWLALKRIGKCHPYHKGEFHDPVPD